MTLVAATSVLAKPKNTLADMLSRSATFQAEVAQPGDAVATWQHIFLSHWVLDTSALPANGPWGVVYLDKNFRLRKAGAGATWPYTPSGGLLIYLRFRSPLAFESSIEDQATTAENFVGHVMTDIMDVNAQGSTNLMIEEMDLAMEPQRISPQQWWRRQATGNYWEAELAVEWGTP